MHQVHAQPVVQPVKGRGHIRTPSDIEAMRPAELRYAPTVGACLSWFPGCTAASGAQQSSGSAPVVRARIAQPQSCFPRPPEEGEEAVLVVFVPHRRCLLVSYYFSRPAVVSACSSRPCASPTARQGCFEPEAKLLCGPVTSCPALLGTVFSLGFRHFWQQKAARGGLYDEEFSDERFTSLTMRRLLAP